MKKLTIAFSVVLFLFLGIFLITPKKKQPKQTLPPVNTIAEDAQKAAIEETFAAQEEPTNSYTAAYNRGYNAFLLQMGRPDLVSPQKIYTSYISNGDEQQDEEAANRGYADGYHKASDAISCPRFKDPRYSGDNY